jgi:predicted TIM-barrel fold metal-dependent hydrolase
LRIEDTHGFDTLAVCHVLIHPIALTNRAHALDAIDWIGWDRLLFATDYPHWDYDDPSSVLPMPLPEQKKRDFFLNNALALYGVG